MGTQEGGLGLKFRRGLGYGFGTVFRPQVADLGPGLPAKAVQDEDGVFVDVGAGNHDLFPLEQGPIFWGAEELPVGIQGLEGLVEYVRGDQGTASPGLGLVYFSGAE